MLWQTPPFCHLKEKKKTTNNQPQTSDKNGKQNTLITKSSTGFANRGPHRKENWKPPGVQPERAVTHFPVLGTLCRLLLNSVC